MSAYLLRRFGQGLLVLWAAFTLTFFLLQVLPGDAVLIKFQNPDLGLSPAQIAEMRLAYGADSPLWRQYLHTLLAMLHGDFGLFPAGGSGGQQSDCQQPAGYLKPRAAGLPAGRGAGVRPRFRLAAAGAALAEQFSAVATGAVYLSTYLLVGYRPDPALLVSVALDPGNQPRPTGRTDFTGYRRRTAHFRPTGADPDAQHGSGGGSALRRGRPAPRA
ncbi:ABC transporter permease [Klebsiella pneumoniae]|uniref:ABC transporter permease n=1 Tax=Klebsiella pneumoniae TaxID=573 RepID=A0A377XBU0_KLEPN|nr:ABC transporter permease [Klebsiella pneumoniae]